MKQLIWLGFLTSLIYPQNRGLKIFKDDGINLKVKTAAIIVATIKQVNNSVVNSEKDLTGCWVGYCGAYATGGHANTIRSESENPNKISVSINNLDGNKVVGHSIIFGNDRPFSGNVKRDGKRFIFNLREPGDEKSDGFFELKVDVGDSILIGTWEVNEPKHSLYKNFVLKKRNFHYNPNVKLENNGQYYGKSKKLSKRNDNGTIYKDTFYLATTDDVYKYNASAVLITKDQAANLKQGDLVILRNSIYARHGYSFKKKPLIIYFATQSWYLPVTTNVEGDLTPTEKKNIELLKRYEKNAKAYYDTFGR